MDLAEKGISKSGLAVGIDFGGTKIEAVLLDRAGRSIWTRRVPNPGGYVAALQAIAALVTLADEEAQAALPVGIGAPGSLSPRTGLMRNSNSLYLNGRPFLHDLTETLRRDVRLTNDANCFALSEANDGAASRAHSVFGLIVGTGVGAGLVVDGRIVDGAHGIAGEVGHLPLPWVKDAEREPVVCWCGREGCIESWISGTGFARAAQANGILGAAPQIVERARLGDEAARAELAVYANRLGRTLAMIVNLFDPETIVIGGGMSNVEEIYPILPSVIRQYAFTDQWDGAVVPARWGDASGVRGAARLFQAIDHHHAAGGMDRAKESKQCA